MLFYYDLTKWNSEMKRSGPGIILRLYIAKSWHCFLSISFLNYALSIQDAMTSDIKPSHLVSFSPIYLSKATYWISGRKGVKQKVGAHLSLGQELSIVKDC
jgi:hypothetical protein